MDDGEAIGLDVGSQRIGVARGSLAARLAEPLASVTTGEAVEKLTELIKELKAKAVVVGLPRGLDGQETGQTRWVRDWTAKFREKVDVECYWQDEALTSKLASHHQSKNGVDEHSLAAAIILQDFLNSPPKRRVLI